MLLLFYKLYGFKDNEINIILISEGKNINTSVIIYRSIDLNGYVFMGMIFLFYVNFLSSFNIYSFFGMFLNLSTHYIIH